MSFLVLAAIMLAVPVGGLAWLRWRFRPKRMSEEADRLVEKTTRRLEACSTEELVALVRAHPFITNGTPAARSLLDHVEQGRYDEALAVFPEVLMAEHQRSRGDPLELSVALTVLKGRQKA